MCSLHALDSNLQTLKPIQTLQKCLDSGRMPHAIFLYGPSLAALEQVAHSLALAMLNTGEEGLKDSDYFCLRPINKMRQIDAQSVRDTLQKLYQTTSQDHKLAILYEADRLNAHAANALLKTLEEPPAKTTLLLLSTRPYEVLPTVLSRCFQFRIRPLVAENPTLDSPQWTAWVQSLEMWLKPLIEGDSFNKAFFAEAILGAYGLVYRFEAILDTLLKAEESPKKGIKAEEAIGTLKAEEKIALESARLKSIRQELLQSIEKALRTIVLPYVLNGKQPHAAFSLCQMVLCFEETMQLLEVNLQIGTALETFFLQTLKLWIRNKV